MNEKSNSEQTRIELGETLTKIVQRIVEGYQPNKIILFGSHAYGQPHSGSDLDLLIIKQTDKRPIDRRVEVRLLLRPLKPHLTVVPIVVTQDEITRRLENRRSFRRRDRITRHSSL